MGSEMCIRDSNNYVKEYDCGIVVDGDSVEALMDGINRLLYLSEEERERLGNNGRKAATEIFNYASLSKAFGEILYE